MPLIPGTNIIRRGRAHTYPRIAIIDMDKSRYQVVKKYLLGTPDRILSSISVVLGLISIFLTIFLWKFPEIVPPLIVLRDVIVLLILLLVSGILLYKYARRESYLAALTQDLSSSNRRLFRQFENTHFIVHKFRSDLFHYYLKRVPCEISVTADEKKLFERI